MIDRRPAIIARCTGAADVVAAVNFARTSGLEVAVRSGGHSVPGYAVCDGGIVIDLSPMKGMWVDPDARTARAQTGLTWGEFDRETQMFGLATTGGRITTTGIGGQTLGSGSGWLERKFGLTLDNLRSAEVVTAAGDIVRASDSEHPELFWGLRGGGGNLGVVTSLEYQLHPVGPILLAGPLLHPALRAVEVIRFWRDYVDTAPDELGTMAAFITAPSAPFVPEYLQGRPAVGIAVCWAGSVEDGERAVRPLREFGPPVADVVQPMPYTAVQAMFDESFPKGHQNGQRGRDGPRGAGGGLDPFRLLRLGKPVGERRAPRLDAGDHGGDAGVSMNFTSDQSRDMVRASFGGPQKYERLVDLKTAYDPTNLFHLNQNIEPRT